MQGFCGAGPTVRGPQQAAGSEIILLGPYSGGDFTSGIDSTDDLAFVPEGFSGYVWTNKAETIAPLLGKRPGAATDQANRQ